MLIATGGRRMWDRHLYISWTDQAYWSSALELGREVLRDSFFLSKDLPVVTALIEQLVVSCGRQGIGEEGCLILKEGA